MLYSNRRNALGCIFQKCVDLNFVGIPPIPLENAEWMGHTSLQ